MEGVTVRRALLQISTRLEKRQHARHVIFPACQHEGGNLSQLAVGESARENPLVDIGTLREYLTHAFCVAGFRVPA